MDLLKKYELFLKELKKNKYIKTIFIFGSYSTNNIKPLSDLDIAIIFDNSTPRNKKIDILSNSSQELDLNDFFDLPLTLLFKIINSGKIYFNRNNNLLRLKLNITHEYNDFKFILNRIYINKGMLSII